MNLPIYWVDAFTKKTFGGNPAAVIPLDSWLDDSLLQTIANENGLSETAFFIRTGAASADLRWFTPAVEVDLCGHATLATAHVLFNELGQAETPFVFKARSGLLSVSRKGQVLELDFPARPGAPARPPADLLTGLGAAPKELFLNERTWLCVYETEDEVRALSPDFSALAKVTPGRFIPTAPGKDCDYVCRFFAPDAGVNEDPVTGSAQCTLVPYWAQRLGKTQLHSLQVSTRGGELWCELAGDRVRIAGHSSLYLKGLVTV
jgi:predicted PhzF superfamily epimerase YddE/YHI9